jgi:hypothetical protein
MEKGIVFITGATSGIGAAFARLYASLGYDLVLTGRREQKIRELADELSSGYKINAEIILADLSEASDIEKVVKRIESLKNIEVLINNAGFGNEKDFENDDIDIHMKMVTVHNEVPVRLSHAVLAQMIGRGSGSVINVSSLGGFVPNAPGLLYGATKAFLINFSEALNISLDRYGIRVQALCPGFTRTDFHEKLGYGNEGLKNHGLFRWMAAGRVVQESYRCLKKKRAVCIPGFLNKVLYLIIKLAPINMILWYMRIGRK